LIGFLSSAGNSLAAALMRSAMSALSVWLLK
jgi:hypothetical protein